MEERLTQIFGGSCERVAFSPDGMRLAAVYGDNLNKITIWDIIYASHSIKEARKRFEIHSRRLVSIAIAFSPTDNTLASSNGKIIEIWDATSGELQLEIDFKTPEPETIRSLAFSPDGTVIAAGLNLGYPEPIKIWDARSGKEIKTLTYDDIHRAREDDWRAMHPLEARQGRGPPSEEREPESTFVTAIAYSPDGRNIAFGSEDFGVRIWNLETGHVQRLSGHLSSITSVAYSSDGTMLASASSTYLDTSISPLVILWDVKTCKMKYKFARHNYVFERVSFSPDNNFIIAANYVNSIMAWDANTHELVHDVYLCDEENKCTGSIHVNDIACARQEKIVALATSKSLLLWDYGK